MAANNDNIDKEEEELLLTHQRLLGHSVSLPAGKGEDEFGESLAGTSLAFCVNEERTDTSFLRPVLEFAG